MERVIKSTILVVFSALAAVSVSTCSPADRYPQTGIVVSMHSEIRLHSVPVYTDPYGKTRGGIVKTKRSYVYTIRANKLYYDVKGKPLAVGSTVEFRVDGAHAHIRMGHKDCKYVIVGERLRDPTSQRTQ